MSYVPYHGSTSQDQNRGIRSYHFFSAGEDEKTAPRSGLMITTHNSIVFASIVCFKQVYVYRHILNICLSKCSHIFDGNIVFFAQKIFFLKTHGWGEKSFSFGVKSLDLYTTQDIGGARLFTTQDISILIYIDIFGLVLVFKKNNNTISE